MGAPVFFFEIISKDATALRAFSASTFGWDVAESIPGAGGVDYTIVTPRPNAGIQGGIGERRRATTVT